MDSDQFAVPRTYLKRFRHHADKKICVLDRSSRAVLHGRCTSLRESGFEAVLAGELPEEEMVTIEFEHEGIEEPLRLIARIRHRQGFRYDFEFVAPDAEHRMALLELFGEDATLD